MNVVQCPGCGARLNVAKLQPGARFKCPKCQTINVVPATAANDSTGAAAEAPKVSKPAVAKEPTAAVPRVSRPAVAKVPVAAPSKKVAGPARAQQRERPGVGRKFGDRFGSHRSTGRFADTDKKGNKKLITIVAAVVAVLAIAGGAFFFAGTDNAGDHAQSQTTEPQSTLSPIEKELKEARSRVQPGDLDGIFLYVVPVAEKNGLDDMVDQEIITVLSIKPDHPLAIAKLTDLYFRKREALVKGDAAGKIALAKWCQKMKFSDAMRREVNEVLLCLDPANEEARALLGWEKVGDKWEEPAYVKKMKTGEEQRAQLRAEAEKLSKREKIVRDLLTTFLGRFGRDKFEYIDSPPYLLFAEKNPTRSVTSALEEYRDVARHLFDLQMKTYGKMCGLEGLAEEVLPVYIFENRERYIQLGGAPWYAGGHFEPGTGYVFLPYDPVTKYQVLFHECTHQFVQFATQFKGKKQSNQWWFTEGIATYFESFTRTPDAGFELGVIGTDNRYFDGQSGAKKIVRKGTYEKFKRFFNMDYATALKRAGNKGGDYMMRMYSQSWSVVYFFHYYDNGKYKAKFEEYTKREIGGQGGFDAAKEIFGDLEELEKQWKDYIAGLSP